MDSKLYIIRAKMTKRFLQNNGTWGDNEENAKKVLESSIAYRKYSQYPDYYEIIKVDDV